MASSSTRGVNAPRNDARPYLLITLLLATGIKKGEAMDLRLDDIDLSDPQQPILYVRYAEAKKRHKERKLKLPADFGETLRRYREQYQPHARLFECTSRHLENVLSASAKIAGLNRFLSFEDLRWTCAVCDLRNGVPADRVRQKLGLSVVTWEDAGARRRLERLAAQPL